MSTFIAFSKYASSAGKAERLAEHVGETVTLTGYPGDTVTGTLNNVYEDAEEGWLAVVTIPGGREPQRSAWVYLSDVASLTGGSL